MVTMFFTVSVINNYALNFNIAMPLHMIFRSVSLTHLFSNPSICSHLFEQDHDINYINDMYFLAGLFNSKHGTGYHHIEKKVG